MKTISFVNQKGGVGKTTSTINVGAFLAERGYKVLLIDLDHQYNLSLSLGLEDAPTTITDALLAKEGSLTIHSVGSLDVVPADISLSAVEPQLYARMGSDYVLKKLIAKLNNKYDFVLIDCPPALSKITVNALTASDYVIVPVECEYLAIKGLALMQDFIEQVKLSTNPNIQLLGVLFTMYDNRNKLTATSIDVVSDNFEEVFKTKIRKNIKLAEAPIHSNSIVQYDKECNGYVDYANLTEEIINKIK